MGLLSWLSGSKSNRIAILEGDGTFELQVVGESNYQPALEKITGGKTEDGHEMQVKAVLEPENTNTRIGVGSCNDTFRG